MMTVPPAAARACEYGQHGMRELAIRASWRCDLDELSALAFVGPSDASSEDSRAETDVVESDGRR